MHWLLKLETLSPDLGVYMPREMAANQGLIQVHQGLGT